MARIAEALAAVSLVACGQAPEADPAACETDADEDGFVDARCGGDDCDDADDGVHPEAWEGPQGWRWETLDPTWNARGAGIAVGRDGALHVVWVLPDGPRYATDRGGRWTIERIADAEPEGRIALVLDAEESPIAGWVASDEAGSLVLIARRGADGWQIEDLAASPNHGHVALAVDGLGVLHAAWADRDGVRHGAHDGAGWQVETVPSLDLAQGSHGPPALAVDTESRVHVAFAAGGRLCHSVREEGGWTTDLVEDVGVLGLEPPAVAAGLDGVVHVVYQHPRLDEVRHAFGSAGGFSIETVDDAGRTGVSVSIAFDSAGALHLGYARMDGPPRHAAASRSGFVLASADVYGVDPAIALGADDVVHMVYAWGGGPLRHAASSADPWLDADCDGVPTDADGDGFLGGRIAQDCDDADPEVHESCADW